MICPACFSNNVDKIDTYTSKGYTFCKCEDCEVIFANPMQAGEKDWYENLGVYTIPEKPRGNLKYHEEIFLNEDISWKDKKILNIGCGPTVFLKNLKSLGCQIMAIDINNRVVDFTKNVLGIEKAFTCDISEFIKNYKGDKFDYIIFFEVLEHLENPGDFMINLKDIVKNTGKIFFSVPNRERMMPFKDDFDYPPHHLTRWNTKCIRRFLGIHGYCVDNITDFSADIANDFMWVIGIYFGTLYLKDKIEKGCKNTFIIFSFNLLFKIRVIFYIIIAMVGRCFITGRKRNIYVIASTNN
jgi:SAM-dependent methyltransferase